MMSGSRWLERTRAASTIAVRTAARPCALHRNSNAACCCCRTSRTKIGSSTKNVFTKRPAETGDEQQQSQPPIVPGGLGAVRGALQGERRRRAARPDVGDQEHAQDRQHRDAEGDRVDDLGAGEVEDRAAAEAPGRERHLERDRHHAVRADEAVRRNQQAGERGARGLDRRERDADEERRAVQRAEAVPCPRHRDRRGDARVADRRHPFRAPAVHDDALQEAPEDERDRQRHAEDRRLARPRVVLVGGLHEHDAVEGEERERGQAVRGDDPADRTGERRALDRRGVVIAHEGQGYPSLLPRPHPADPGLACHRRRAGARGTTGPASASRSRPSPRARCSSVRSQTSSAVTLIPCTPVRRSWPHTASA